MVPLDEFPRNEDGSVNQQVVEKFESQTLTLLNWSIGVHGSF